MMMIAVDRRDLFISQSSIDQTMHGPKDATVAVGGTFGVAHFELLNQQHPAARSESFGRSPGRGRAHLQCKGDESETDFHPQATPLIARACMRSIYRSPRRRRSRPPRTPHRPVLPCLFK
jgi:hypothetical protein